MTSQIDRQIDLLMGAILLVGSVATAVLFAPNPTSDPLFAAVVGTAALGGLALIAVGLGVTAEVGGVELDHAVVSGGIDLAIGAGLFAVGAAVVVSGDAWLVGGLTFLVGATTLGRGLWDTVGAPAG